MSKRVVLIVDLGNFLDTRIVDDYLIRKGFEVIRPTSQDDLMVALSGGPRGYRFQPDFALVLYYQFSQLTWLLPLLRRMEGQGVRVVNACQDLSLFSNLPFRNVALTSQGIEVPEHFHGHSWSIPESLGETVVLKSLTSHLSVLCPRQGIHSLNEPVYVEQYIPNPDKRILTIYQVAGCRYARFKEDALQTKEKIREMVTDLGPYGDQLRVIDRLAQSFGLVIFNAEFIGRVVIDVNVIANFYYPEHPEPLEALAEWLAAK